MHYSILPEYTTFEFRFIKKIKGYKVGNTHFPGKKIQIDKNLVIFLTSQN